MKTQVNNTNNQPTAELFALWREVSELDIDTREVIENMLNGKFDFDVDTYRFIHKDEIDEIQQDELAADEYCLGCFFASFLADVLEIDQDAIEAMQKAEAYEAIGKLIISLDKIEDLQQAYAAADGYGHHFSHYDGEEKEIGDYYVFRVNY